MSLIVHVGGAESDSFATLVEAYGMLDEMFVDISTWEELSAEQKELRLHLAAQLMGSLPLRGGLVFRNQRLCFPRTSQPYNQRFSIPMWVKKAQAYLAFEVIHRALISVAGVEEGMPSLTGSPSQISLAGLVSVSFKDSDKKGGTVFDKIVGMLPFPVYMMMKKYITQIRGGTVLDTASTLSTTTTMLVITTTTTV